MRAINCTQCGATINDVSEHSVIIDCDYCGARIMLNRAQPAEPIEPPRSISEPAIVSSEGAALKVISVGVGAVILIPVVIFALVILNKPRKVEPVKAYSVPTPAPVLPVWNAPSFEPQKPVPVVNYQPRVSWSGPNDMEHFASPEVDITSMSHLTSDEIKKTVFKNRIVKLRVVINTEGEIDTVETISGHPLLVEAATESAKKSIFSSRSRPTTRVLTYTFRVLKDD